MVPVIGQWATFWKTKVFQNAINKKAFRDEKTFLRHNGHLRSQSALPILKQQHDLVKITTTYST
jgi:hypothetical protein